MDICFILPCYPIKPIGGFKVVYEYANEFVKQGHNVKVIHPYFMNNHPRPEKLLAKIKVKTKQIYFHLFPKEYSKEISWQPIDDKVELIYVPYLHEKYIPNSDIIIATAWQTAEAFESFSDKKGRKVYFIQGYETWNGDIERVHNTWKLPIKKVVISSWLAEIGKTLGAQNTVVVHNAINHDKYILKNTFEERGKKVLMLYHEGKWKGTQDGLKALSIAKEVMPNLQATLFGHSERGKDIPEWIEYIQNPSQEDIVNRLYNNSSIYLCPSLSEGWGLPASEAMACGCAVVSTENGGVKDFAIHEKTALLSPINDPTALANNLIKLLNDDVLRIKIAKAGQKYIKRFNYTNSAKLFENILATEMIKVNYEERSGSLG